jgi:hypothetical protein
LCGRGNFAHSLLGDPSSRCGCATRHAPCARPTSSVRAPRGAHPQRSSNSHSLGSRTPVHCPVGEERPDLDRGPTSEHGGSLQDRNGAHVYPSRGSPPRAGGRELLQGRGTVPVLLVGRVARVSGDAPRPRAASPAPARATPMANTWETARRARDVRPGTCARSRSSGR